jgi:hypothetical protein
MCVHRLIIVAAAAILTLLCEHAAAESSLQSGDRTAHGGASAHLDFKIVIPPAIALSLDAATSTPIVFTNTRHVSVIATQEQGMLSDTPHRVERSASTIVTPRRHAVVSQQVRCQIDTAPPGGDGRRDRDRRRGTDSFVCTVASI